jgi:hypothetical protein
VAENGQVGVLVNQPRHHRPAAGVDDRGTGGDLHLARRADGGDLVVFDQDRGVVNGRDVVAVDEHASHQREVSFRPRVLPRGPLRRRLL